jgi:hypothetical protein
MTDCVILINDRLVPLSHTTDTPALSPGGGRSGHNYQLLRVFHEYHQHHESVLSSDTAVLRSALFGCEARPFPSMPLARSYSLAQRVPV